MGILIKVQDISEHELIRCLHCPNDDKSLMDVEIKDGSYKVFCNVCSGVSQLNFRKDNGRNNGSTKK